VSVPANGTDAAMKFSRRATDIAVCIVILVVAVAWAYLAPDQALQDCSGAGPVALLFTPCGKTDRTFPRVAGPPDDVRADRRHAGIEPERRGLK
jgi:hypothetical protein